MLIIFLIAESMPEHRRVDELFLASLFGLGAAFSYSIFAWPSPLEKKWLQKVKERKSVTLRLLVGPRIIAEDPPSEKSRGIWNLILLSAALSSLFFHGGSWLFWYLLGMAIPPVILNLKKGWKDFSSKEIGTYVLLGTIFGMAFKPIVFALWSTITVTYIIFGLGLVPLVIAIAYEIRMGQSERRA